MADRAAARLPTGRVTFLFSDLERSTEHLRELGMSFEILLAENGSTDRTVEQCRELGAKYAEVDFFSVGTNDLVQYLLAADRTNPLVSRYYDHLHPAVVAALRHVAEAARREKCGLSICGETSSRIQAAKDSAIAQRRIAVGLTSMCLWLGSNTASSSTISRPPQSSGPMSLGNPALA